MAILSASDIRLFWPHVLMGLSIHKPRLVTETAKKGKLNFKSGYFQSIMAIFSATVLKLLTLLDGLKKRAFILHCQAIKNSIGIQLNSVCKLNLEKLFFPLNIKFFQILMRFIWLPCWMWHLIRMLRLKSREQRHLLWSVKILTKQLEYIWRTHCKLIFKRGYFQSDIFIL